MQSKIKAHSPYERVGRLKKEQLLQGAQDLKFYLQARGQSFLETGLCVMLLDMGLYVICH
jgi:hypothetical protein